MIVDLVPIDLMKSDLVIRPDLLNVLLLKPGGSKSSQKIKFDHVIELIHTHMWLRHRWLVCGSVWKSFQAALCYLGPESLTVPRRKLLATFYQG